MAQSDSSLLSFLPALNCSLVLVSCDRYPDVCALYNITTYPSVRVFHGSSLLPPTPLTETLDSAHLLSALSQHTLPLQSRTVVREGGEGEEGEEEGEEEGGEGEEGEGGSLTAMT